MRIGGKYYLGNFANVLAATEIMVVFPSPSFVLTV
jgi:hypothetical protein